MANSKTEICNLALAYLGANPIASMDDDSKRARLCKTYYQTAVDAVLRAHPWNCATFRTWLPRSTKTPAWGYASYFVLPTDPYCLRVIRLNVAQASWKIENRLLACDLEAVAIEYIGRIEDPTQYDSMLVDTIASGMGMKIGVPLVQDKKALDALYQLHQIHLRDARGVDGMEGTIDADSVGAWEAAASGVEL